MSRLSYSAWYSMTREELYQYGRLGRGRVSTGRVEFTMVQLQVMDSFEKKMNEKYVQLKVA